MVKQLGKTSTFQMFYLDFLLSSVPAVVFYHPVSMKNTFPYSTHCLTLPQLGPNCSLKQMFSEAPNCEASLCPVWLLPVAFRCCCCCLCSAFITNGLSWFSKLNLAQLQSPGENSLTGHSHEIWYFTHLVQFLTYFVFISTFHRFIVCRYQFKTNFPLLLTALWSPNTDLYETFIGVLLVLVLAHLLCMFLIRFT